MSRGDLERDIERTRADLAETVDALTSKLDVKSRAQHKASDLKDTVQQQAKQPRNRYAGVAVALGVVAVVGYLVWSRRD